MEERLGNYRLATERAVGELQANRDRQNGLRSSLELRGEQGLQTACDAAVTLLSHLEREHEGEEARAEAARVLRDTFAKHREQAHQRYIGPFRESIEQLGRIVFGPTFEVEIDRNLNIARRTLDGVTLLVEQLSTGAREGVVPHHHVKSKVLSVVTANGKLSEIAEIELTHLNPKSSSQSLRGDARHSLL